MKLGLAITNRAKQQLRRDRALIDVKFLSFSLALIKKKGADIAVYRSHLEARLSDLLLDLFPEAILCVEQNGDAARRKTDAEISKAYIIIKTIPFRIPR
jgi:hypothetical protein